MATSTKSNISGAGSDWTNPNDAVNNNSVCATQTGGDVDSMWVITGTSSIYGTITTVRCLLNAFERADGYQSGLSWSFSKNSGSNYCDGHSMTIAAAGTGDCDDTANTPYVTCDHAGYGLDLTDLEWNTATCRARITSSHFGGDNPTFYVDYIGMSALYTPATIPGTPADPTISATAVKTMHVVATNPSDGGTALDDIEIQISTSSTFASGNITWTKGSAPTVTSQTHDFTSGDGVVDGTLYYARTRYHNGVGWGAYNTSPYNSATSWDVPANADLSNATTTEISTVTVTKAVVDPDDGGEPIDQWEVWRADTEFGGYSKLTGSETAIGTTTYQDTTLAGGETKWYKSKYINLVGTGILSTNGISGTALENLNQSAGDLLSNSRIKQLGFGLLDQFSDTAIYRAGYDTKDQFSDTAIYRAGYDTKDQLSDTAIYQSGYDTKDLDSNTVIYREGYDTKLLTSNTEVMKIGEIQRVSTTTIRNVDFGFTSDSNTAIRRIGYDTLDRSSDTAIENTDSMPLDSNTLIKGVYSNPLDSITAIFRAAYNTINQLSDSRIVEEGTIVLPEKVSNTRILSEKDITKASDTLIVWTFENALLSDTTVFNARYGLIDTLSNTIIRIPDNALTPKLSDTTIYRAEYDDKSKTSNTRIKRVSHLYCCQNVKSLSNTRIRKTIAPLELKSITRIKNIDKQITPLDSDTLIKIYPILPLDSNTVIKIFNNDLIIDSRTRIKKTITMSDKLSNTIIRLPNQTITPKLSDTLIIRNINIPLDSQTIIFKSGLLITPKLSDTLILSKKDIPQTSDTTVFNASWGNIQLFSEAAISILNNEFTLTSDSRALRTFSVSITSDASIRRDRSNLRAIFQKGRQL